MKKINNLNGTKEQNKRKFIKRHWKKFVLGATLMSVLCGSVISNNSHKKDDEISTELTIIEKSTEELQIEKELEQIVKGDITSLKGDITILKGDITSLKGDINDPIWDFNDIKRDLNDLIGNLSNLIKHLNNLEADIVECGLDSLELLLDAKEYLEYKSYIENDQIGLLEKPKSYVPVYRNNEKNI